MSKEIGWASPDGKFYFSMSNDLYKDADYILVNILHEHPHYPYNISAQEWLLEHGWKMIE